MRLAILVHAIGQGAYAPVFHLHDLAAELLDDAGHLGGQFFNLLGARILTREKNMLIKRHGCPYQLLARFPAASPSNPSERTRYAQKAEARDDGPTGPATSTTPEGEIAETVRSAPGRDPRMARFIRILRGMARESGRFLRSVRPEIDRESCCRRQQREQ